MKALIVFLLFAVALELQATTDDPPEDAKGIPECNINQWLCGFVTNNTCSNLTVMPDDVALPQLIGFDPNNLKKDNGQSKGRSNLQNNRMSLLYDF